MVHTLYGICFSDVDESIHITLSGRTFATQESAEEELEEHGFEKLAKPSNNSDAVSRFVNLKFKPSVKESYFDAPRAEVIKVCFEI